MTGNQNKHSYWLKKDSLSMKAEKHTSKMQSKYAQYIADSITNTIIYDHTPDFLISETLSVDSSISIEDLDSVSAIFKYPSKDNSITALLNFASFKHPGGYFIEGSSAQEESICHGSSLYNVISDKKFSAFYSYNQQHLKNGLYSNRALYSRDIIFDNDLNTPCFADVITCAAPNKATATSYQQVTASQNSAVLNDRIDFVLHIAAAEHVSTLILGAYGCGVFGQDPIEVAQVFKSQLDGKYKNIFKKIIFAIPKSFHSSNYEAFCNILNNAH